VASCARLSAADTRGGGIQQFDPSFNASFRTGFISTVADAAGVEPYRVSVQYVTAGSVRVGFMVQFPLTAATAKESFADTLASDTGSVFESSTDMQVRRRSRCIPYVGIHLSFPVAGVDDASSHAGSTNPLSC
jgi:hypothetical protein